ncbi:MAG: hypothetical protein R3314_00875 [Longimicrobiales bacterium]|nr:hypothetical protein [Longimicrobiales bacterium]
MTDPGRWLDARDVPAPPAVRAAVTARVAETDPSAPAHDRFAAAALMALGAVIEEPSRRATAHDLLAADALLTYACEAAAEAGLDELDRLTAALDLARFSDLLPESS